VPFVDFLEPQHDVMRALRKLSQCASLEEFIGEEYRLPRAARLEPIEQLNLRGRHGGRVVVMVHDATIGVLAGAAYRLVGPVL